MILDRLVQAILPGSQGNHESFSAFSDPDTVERRASERDSGKGLFVQIEERSSRYRQKVGLSPENPY